MAQKSDKIKVVEYNWVYIRKNLRYRREDCSYSKVKYSQFRVEKKSRPLFFGLIGEKKWRKVKLFSGVTNVAFRRMMKFINNL